MSATICPRCGSSEIRGDKQDMGNDTLYSFYCNRCRLYEDHLRSEPDFQSWLKRWSSRTLDRRVLANVLDERAPRTALFGLLVQANSHFPATDDAGWHPVAFELRGRSELWLMLDDKAVTACKRELGAERLGTISPPSR